MSASAEDRPVDVDSDDYRNAGNVCRCEVCRCDCHDEDTPIPVVNPRVHHDCEWGDMLTYPAELLMDTIGVAISELFAVVDKPERNAYACESPAAPADLLPRLLIAQVYYALGIEWPTGEDTRPFLPGEIPEVLNHLRSAT